MNPESKIDSYPFSVRPLSVEEGGGYLIEYPDLPGCVSDGDSPEEAIRNGRDAVLAYIRSCVQHSDPVPIPAPVTVAARVPARINIKRIRSRTKLSQSEFAKRFGFNVRTLQDWECGRSRPDVAARAYLVVIAKDPAAVETVGEIFAIAEHVDHGLDAIVAVVQRGRAVAQMCHHFVEKFLQ